MNRNDTLRFKGQGLKVVLRKEKVNFYQVQSLCKKILNYVKFDKYNEAKGVILEAYILAKIQVPREVIDIEGDDGFYAFLSGLVPEKEEFE